MLILADQFDSITPEGVLLILLLLFIISLGSRHGNRNP